MHTLLVTKVHLKGWDFCTFVFGEILVRILSAGVYLQFVRINSSSSNKNYFLTRGFLEHNVIKEYPHDHVTSLTVLSNPHQ